MISNWPGIVTGIENNWKNIIYNFSAPMKFDKPR